MSNLSNCKTGWRQTAFDEPLIEKCAKFGIEVLENDCFWNDESVADYDYNSVQKLCRRYGIYMQSVHLALGDKLDISNELTKGIALDVIKRQIYSASTADIKYGVLHLSAEPIADNERKMRFDTALRSVNELADYAEKCSFTLCIENLPRSCLCNDIDEMKAVLQDSRLKVCFDVNHLLKCSHCDFVSAFGSKIVTTHISDYDFSDDRHWVPGCGKIDWRELAGLLEAADYSGAFLFECDVYKQSDGRKIPDIEAYKKIHNNIANRREPLLGV